MGDTLSKNPTRRKTLPSGKTSSPYSLLPNYRYIMETSKMRCRHLVNLQTMGNYHETRYESTRLSTET